MRISLFGYGGTTKALAKILDNVVFYDDKCHKPFVDTNGFSVKPSSEFHPDYSDMEIISPGIPPFHPLVKKAKNLISEYDYFEGSSPLKIWISGTNGKTTTTQMMQHLLEDKMAECGGNIGTPLAELSQDAPLWILETSSFTIHHSVKAQPNIYILLPLSQDHLSWHGSMQEYEEAKLKPLKLMKEGEIAIVPQKYKDIKTDAFVIGYQNENDLAEYFGIDKEKIPFKGAFLLDALLAMSVDKILFDRISYEKIALFEVESHRQEEIKDVYDRLWVNDSKATNPHASMVALERYKKSFIHLILGGDDKGVDLQELFTFLQKLEVCIYAIGSNKKRLLELSQVYNIEAKEMKNLEDAVVTISKVLKKDEIALLSPAAASLDEFSSYAQRGNEFKQSILTIS